MTTHASWRMAAVGPCSISESTKRSMGTAPSSASSTTGGLSARSALASPPRSVGGSGGCGSGAGGWSAAEMRRSMARRP
eukprot:1212817-Prymnesium_polylepis.1